MVAPLEGWLREHLYVIVFLGAFVDAIGVPFPGRIMLMTVGSLYVSAQDGVATAPLLVGLATIATVAGDHTWYFLGRLKGQRLFQFFSHAARLSEKRIATADRMLRRYGGLALVLARFAATLRIIIVPLAVSRGLSYGRFLALDSLGALLWVAGFVWLGRAAGAVGARSGVAGVLTALGALAVVSVVTTVATQRWLSGRASVS